MTETHMTLLIVAVSLGAIVTLAVIVGVLSVIVLTRMKNRADSQTASSQNGRHDWLPRWLRKKGSDDFTPKRGGQ